MKRDFAIIVMNQILLIQILDNNLNILNMEKKCEKSPDGKHKLIYPRYEESLDKDRAVSKPYCSLCFERIDFQTEEDTAKKIVPFVGERLR